jgi:signal transduction histidine kinase
MSLAVQTTPLIAALEQLGPHDHFCSIYESPQEHYAVAIPFIRIGLDRGEKCIYIADDDTVGDVRQAMQSEGIDVDRAIASKALVLATKEQAYLAHGSFHPDWMFTFWKETTQLAMSEGFSALRATGETEWVLRGGRGLERWMEYESRLTHTLSESNCSALCQYNRRLFPPELILDVIRTHPMVVYGSTVCRNLYYVPPDEFLGTNQTAREVERLLTNIREREHVEDALREQLTERKRAEEALREAQAELARVTRVTILGELAASIAHEINQPLAAVITNGSACLRWLAGATPNLDEAREAVARIIRDGNRASDVIGRIRTLVRKSRTEQVRLDINEVIQEVVGLIQTEIQKNGVVLRMQLAADLPRVLGDRVQLQQVILNLVMNGIEAMSAVTDRSRNLLLRSYQYESDKVLIAVQDSGIGLQPGSLDHLFEAFFTTKPKGMGMGLAISRSIIEAHGGRLWAVPNDGPGVTFEFALPVEAADATRNSRPEATRNESD